MIARFQAIPELQTVLPELFEWMTQTFPEEQKVAIGLSGGADSMLVAFLFASFWVQQNRDPHQLFFVHCNHGVRRESHEEEAFLR